MRRALIILAAVFGVALAGSVVHAQTEAPTRAEAQAALDTLQAFVDANPDASPEPTPTPTPTPDPLPAFSDPVEFQGWGLAVHEGDTEAAPGGWSATPECWTGDSDAGQDATPDHLVVGSPLGYFDLEPYRIGSVDESDDVVTRVRVEYEWLDTGEGDEDWYTIRHFDDRTGRLQQGLTQSWSWDFAGATSPYLASLGSTPTVASGPLEWRMFVQYGLNTQAAQVTCGATVVVYDEGDPSAPAGASVAQDAPHPTEHPPFSLGLVDQTFVGVYQGDLAGLPAGVECDGFDDNVSVADFGSKGKFRFEADLGQPKPDTIGATDLWVFRDFGAGERFTWRDRTTNLSTAGIELNQSAQAPHVRLPDGSLTQDHQPHVVIFTSHYHLGDELHDMEGQICEARVEVR